jgi:signal transduction histidine kinase
MQRILSALLITPVVLSLGLLALLLLVSTQPGDDVARRLDLALRQSVDLAPRITGVAAGGLEDAEAGSRAAETLGVLGDALDERLRLARDAFDTLHPADPGALERARVAATTAFDVIDPTAAARAKPESLRTEFGAVEATAAVFDARLDATVAALERWTRSARFVDLESRRLVSDLRERRADAAADAIFGGVAQLRTRIAGTGLDAAGADALVDGLVAEAALAPGEDRQRLQALAGALRDLVPARTELEAAEDALRASPLPDLLVGLRDQIGADIVQRLSTLGDARVLLNVYTALLLGVLVWFGARLAASHRALNRVNEDLEQRVTERTRDLVRANDDLKESQVQLVQAEKMSSLGQLVAGVMHEVNTPLMYVQSNVATSADSLAAVTGALSPALELARDLRAGRTDRERLQDHLKAIRAQVDPEDVDLSLEEVRQLSEDSLDGLEQISELVQSLKDFSRLDRAERDRFDVREGLEKTLVITRNLLKYGIEVERDYAEVPAIPCSPSRLNQVFINLVTNAVQAMDGAGTLRLETRDLGDHVQVIVSDTGCGIPAEHIAQVTDPFFTTKPVGEGTGLGLSIVRQIVDEHGGHFEIDSEPGTGTVITITLPVDEIDAGSSGADSVPTTEEAA